MITDKTKKLIDELYDTVEKGIMMDNGKENKSKQALWDDAVAKVKSIYDDLAPRSQMPNAIFQRFTLSKELLARYAAGERKPKLFGEMTKLINSVREDG